MLIGDVPIDESNRHQVFDMLRALDTGFPGRTVAHYPEIRHPPDFYAQEAVNAYQEWMSNPCDDTLQNAYRVIGVACQIGEFDANQLAQAERLQVFGGACCLLHQTDEGIAALEKAVAIYEQHQYVGDNGTHGLQSALTELCDALANYISAIKKQDGVSVDFLEEQRSKLSRYTKQAANVFYLGDGVAPVDPSAYRIEQSEIAFFNKNHAVGSIKMGDCLLLDFEHPEKAAATHYDIGSGINSLQLIFDDMPAGMLQTRYVGAAFPPGHDNESGAESSTTNVNNVTGFLFDKNVNTFSAAIGDPYQPTDVVIGPNHQIKEAIPGRNNPDMLLSGAKLLLRPWGAPLHIALDLTVCDKRAPYLFQANEVDQLKTQWAGKNIEELYDWAKTQPESSSDRIPVCVGEIMECVQRYNVTVNHILCHLDNTVESLPIKPDAFLVHQVIQAIEQHAIHLGSEANVANQPMVDFITTQFFKINTIANTGEQYVTGDLEGLKAITYDEQPIKAIRAAHQKAMDHIVEKLDKTISDLKTYVEIDPAHRAEAIEIIRNHSISIGEGANQANQPLVDFVGTKLFVLRQDPSSNRAVYIFNRVGLNNLWRPQPAMAQTSSPQRAGRGGR
ncbi:MAG TPA: hypothetical protein VM532_11055 [Burkholderiales bacterium]|nr:hypothetical protein [Burkholderiales bacterium]